MSRKLIFLGVLFLILAPGAALSLGLGEIRLNSYLNQPMDAEIALSVSSAAELDTLRVGLASTDAFRRHGLDRPAYLDDLRFQVSPTGPTTAVVRITSTRPMVEPFLTFLVEARWGGGRILREYTVLLDPPVFLPAPEAAPVPAPAPPPAVERPRPAPEPVARPAPTPAPAVAPRAVGAEYTVRRNDTLWQIAQQVRPDDTLTTNQVMMALFRENPNAFDGNINRLRAGAILRIPSRENMAASSVGEANVDVRRHTEEWRAAVAAPPVERRLELAPPTETPRPPAPVADPVAAAPADELLEAVQDLRSELAETRRMMELKDAEIAALQARLAEIEGVPPVEPEPAAPVAEVDEPAVAVPEPAPEPVAAPAPPPVPVAPTMLDRIFAVLGSLWFWLVAALVLIIGAMALFLNRRKDDARSIEEELAETGTWGALEPTGAELAAGAGAGTAAAAATRITPRKSRPDEASIQVEETAAEPGPVPVRPAVEPTAPADKPAEEDYQYPFEDTIAGETGINLDQSDPLAEADFHMAYGLYDQAADIVRKAIDREPDRYDLRRKLIDICFVWGNAEEFLSQAKAIRERGGAEADADWGKIAIMGRQICPGEPLFEGAEAAGVDVDLGTVSVPAADVQEDISASGSWLDFDVGESDVPTEGLGDTREQPAPDLSGKRKDATAELDLEELGIDLDLGESGEYALKDLAERAPEDDEVAEAGTPEEETPETAVMRTERASQPEEEPFVELPDEEEEDGGTLMMDASQLPRSAEDPTQRGEGFELDEDEPTLSGESGLEEVTESVRKASDEEPTVMGVDSGLEEEDEGDHTLVKKFTMPADEAPTQEVDAFEEDPDLDLDDLTQMLETDPTPRAGDDEATLAVTGIESESPVEEDIGDTREMPPAELDEVGTKLDLARAYIDMGDPDGARSILEEVVAEGDEAQQQEARELLESLG